MSFLNIDVELEGRVDLGPLVAALGERIVALRDERLPSGTRALALELGFTSETETPADVLHRWLAFLEALPPSARAAWDGAERRVLDLGFRADTGTRGAWRLAPATLARVAALGAELAVTVYGDT